MNLKEKLQESRLVLGSWLNTASPVVAELLAATGFHFVTVDVEHSPVDVPQAQVLFQAIRSGRRECSPLVRLAGNRYADNKRFMDAGAAGVIAPFINNATQARELIASVKYPPEGLRGVGFCRANNYGRNLAESVAGANRETFVCAQIEDVEAVDNIDEILAVKGIDAIMIGPYDLSASMGITAEFDHPEMIAATGKVLAACHRHRVAAGIHVVQPEPAEVVRRWREGYRFIAYSLDITMLTRACIQGLEEIATGIEDIAGQQ